MWESILLASTIYLYLVGTLTVFVWYNDTGEPTSWQLWLWPLAAGPAVVYGIARAGYNALKRKGDA